MPKQVFSPRKISIVIILTGLVAFLASFSPGPASLADDVLTYTNKYRKSKGKSILIMKEDLSRLARKHSEDMARGRVAFGHGGFSDRHEQAKRTYKSCSMSENVAYGVSTGKDVVNMWQRSSGHRANMLGNFKYIGIGTATDKRGRIYYTQIFVR